jgi:DNA/RNA endonuclease YhcR with UshA esterase domain
MKKITVLFVVGLLMVFAGSALALDNIVDIHVNDATGSPTAPYAIGTLVSIRGIISAEFTNATAYYTRAYIQDATGGINVYDAAAHVCFLPGEDVSIEGSVQFYRGCTEVVPTSYTIHSGGNPCPAPKELTIAQLNASFLGDYTEPDEGRVITIKNVTITGTTDVVFASKTYTITDGVNSGALYIYGGACCVTHPLIGTNIPTGPFDAIGILTQYDSTSPYTTGYQISPRAVCDLIIPSTPVSDATWGRIKTLFR